MSVFRFSRRCAAASLVILLSVAARAAEPLTLPQAQALAIARSQQLTASNASIAASREMAVAAGQLPDPVLKLGIENLPLNGPDRFSLSRDFMTMRRIGLSQELPGAQKRQLRTERVEREADRIRADSRLIQANILRETANAWIERYYTEQMRALVLRQLEETELQARTAESGFGVGRNSQSEVFAARSALVMLRDKLSQIDRQDANATSTLTRWVGADGTRPLVDAPPWQSSRLDDGLLDEHIQYHPDLDVLRAQVEIALADAVLAEAGKKADWSVEAMYSQRGPAYSNMVSFGVSVPLQWDQKNRQNREVAAKLAIVEEARARYEEMLRQHKAEVRNLLNDWKTAKSRAARFRDELVPLAQRRTQASLTEYRIGKSPLAAALLARRDEIDVRLQALTVEMETARAWAQLNFLIPDHGTVQRQEKP